MKSSRRLTPQRWVGVKVLITSLGLFLLPATLSGQPISRHILALYDSELGEKSDENNIHANAETVLNHLGCIVDYWDVSRGLPDETFMQKYLGVITWYHDNSMNDPIAYFRWASRQLQLNKKVLIIGSMASFKNRRTNEVIGLDVINRFTRKMGFSVSAGGVD